MVKNSPANTGDIRDVGSIPGLGRSPGRGHSNPLQYSCLENPMDRGAWWATVHRVAQSWTSCSNLACMQTRTCLLEVDELYWVAVFNTWNIETVDSETGLVQISPWPLNIYEPDLPSICLHLHI